MIGREGRTFAAGGGKDNGDTLARDGARDGDTLARDGTRDDDTLARDGALVDLPFTACFQIRRNARASSMAMCALYCSPKIVEYKRG